MPKTPANPQPPSKPPLTSPFPLVGKPWQRRFPTPQIEDYIVSVRKDTRIGFTMPKKGDLFAGVDQQDRLSKKFTFATAVPVEQSPGFVDLYYLAPFPEQENYNFTIAYPFTDKAYPQFTRTYIVQRTDDLVTKEPDADAFDPEFGRPFQLTEHKIERFTDDPVMDANFVRIVRVFERLPGPVITSFKNNQYQQVVTVRTQDVAQSTPPPQSALTEVSGQERTGTAKAKNTLATVPEVFPQAGSTVEIPSMTRELWLGGFDETTDSQVSAGQVEVPQIAPGKYSVAEKQVTKFKKEITIKALPLPQTRHHKELAPSELGGGVLEETISIDTPTSLLDLVDGGYLITEARFRNLGQWGKIALIKQLIGSEWPELTDVKTISEGVYSGVAVQTLKKVVPAPASLPPGYNPFLDGVFWDLKPHDKWKTFRLKSSILVFPTTPLVYFDEEEVHFPAQLQSVDVQWTIASETQASGALNLDDTEGHALASSKTTQTPSLIHTATDGYRGFAKSKITRTFVLANPNGGLPSNVVAQITKIAPSFGTALLNGSVIGGTSVDGNTQHSLRAEGEIKRAFEHFGPYLTGNINQNFYAPYSYAEPVGPVIVDVTAGPKPKTCNATMFSLGARPFATVVIPASIPAALVSGQSIVWRVRVTRGLLNLYAIEKIEVFIP